MPINFIPYSAKQQCEMATFEVFKRGRKPRFHGFFVVLILLCEGHGIIAVHSADRFSHQRRLFFSFQFLMMMW